MISPPEDSCRFTGSSGHLALAQQKALQSLQKRALAALAAELATKHGTRQHRYRSRSVLERLPREELVRWVVGLLRRAHQGRAVHLGELGGCLWA